MAGSPNLFEAKINGSVARLVGACSNDGTYFVVRRYNVADGEVWSFKVAGYTATSRLIECHTAAIWRAWFSLEMLNDDCLR